MSKHQVLFGLIIFLFLPMARAQKPLISFDAARENPVETSLEGQRSQWAAKCIEHGKDGPYFALRDPKLPIEALRMQVEDKMAIEVVVRFSQPIPEKGLYWIFEINRYTQIVWITRNDIVFRSTISQNGKPKQISNKFLLNGTGLNSLGYYLNGWHHFVFQVDAKKGKAQLWIDGQTNDQLQATTTPGESLCKEGNCLSIYTLQKFQGDFKKINFYDQILSDNTIRQHYKEWIGKPVPRNVSKVESQQKGAIDPKEFAPGHPRVQMSSLSQLQNFPSPRYKPGHALHRQFNWMELRFLAGMTQSYAPTDDLARISTDLQKELITRWNYMLALQNVNLANNRLEWDPEKGYMSKWVDLANQYPRIPLSITTFQAQVGPLYKGKERGPIVSRPNLPDSYYVRDSKGKFILKANRKVLSIEAPDELIKLDGEMVRKSLDRINQALRRPIDFVNENGEVAPYGFGKDEIWFKDPKVMKEFQRSRLEWEDYIANRKLHYRQLYKNQFMNHPLVKDATFTWYAIDGGFQDRFKYDISRKIHSPIRGQYYATSDFYPRYPSNWSTILGAWRGWKWIDESRKVEIMAGDKLFSPFVAAGWNSNPETNIRPSQWLGLLKVLPVVGAEFFYVGFFNVTSGSGPQAFADPRNYIWQAAMPSYAQAIASQYEDILKDGSLLRDTKGQPIVRIPTNDPRILVAVRKHPTQSIYIIAGTLQPISNVKGNVVDQKVETITFDGQQISCAFRRQGSVYYYDARDEAHPVFFQVDHWHEAGHPMYWSKDFLWEAEVNDGMKNMVIQTNRQDKETGRFVKYQTFVKPQDKKARITFEWDVIRSEQRNLELSLYACASRKGGVEVWIDGKQIGTITNIQKPWDWYKEKGVKLKNLSIGRHKLELVVPSGFYLDKVKLTRS
ncbi:MAG: hypothetical protein AAFP89_21535 [Bacteroidota bacterium]